VELVRINRDLNAALKGKQTGIEYCSRTKVNVISVSLCCLDYVVEESTNRGWTTRGNKDYATLVVPEPSVGKKEDDMNTI
jgi:hypothetical protein